MKRTKLVCVGACAIDTILTVPHFPEEDSKTRATSFSKRRGGNTPNMLEVLQQLIDDDGSGHDHATSSSAQRIKQATELFLVATLPARESTHVAFIARSFNHSNIFATTYTHEDALRTLESSYTTSVNLSYCVYREDFTKAVSSYIISSQATSSRTIINNNVLPEMTFKEFTHISRDLFKRTSSIAFCDPIAQTWFHFEGRIPATTLECIRHLRVLKALASINSGASSQMALKISVELEKPGREGLQDLAFEADVIFYSKAWAEGEGYYSAEDCLDQQAKLFSARSGGEAKTNDKTLICTWGEQGAYALVLPCTSSSQATYEEVTQSSENDIIHSQAYISPGNPIVDSTGAGDTFIAGVLFGLICRNGDEQTETQSWSLKQALGFANGLAGRKILQDGFQGLGESSRGLRKTVDLEGE